MQYNASAAVAWGPNRLDLFGLGTDNAMYHKAWNGSAWDAGWESLGGTFNSPPVAVSWGENRIDLFALGTDNAMYHKAWNGSAWLPAGWEPQGGTFNSPPAVVCWGENRIDIFGLGTDNSMYHKAWDGSAWDADWEALGGTFNSTPVAVSWGENRIDLFGLGTDNAMYHKAWDGSAWDADWEALGGIFTTQPAAVCWGPNRIDLFAVGIGDSGTPLTLPINQMFHKAWNGSAWDEDWESLGGVFNSAPAVCSWGENRLDVFGLGTDNAMYHKAWDGNAWLPTDWEPQGGVFNSAPIAVSWGFNRIDLFGLGTDNAMYHKAWDGSAWLPAGWEPQGGVFNQPMMLRLSLKPPAPIPTSGLGGASNYFFADISNKNIIGLTITIVITEDLATAAPTGSNQNTEAGFSFQLNCQSPVFSANPNNPNWIVWQQYTVMIRNEADGWVNNWTAASLPNGPITIEPSTTTFAPLARPGVLPAGSTLTIELENDGAGNVAAVYFNLQPGGTRTPITLTGQPLAGGGTVTSYNLAPIVTFTLNLVGPEDSVHAHFISGAGSIFYGVNDNENALMPLPQLPTSVADGQSTAETANSFYSPLTLGPSVIFQQDFRVDPNTW
jgi:hypothetical protein